MPFEVAEAVDALLKAREADRLAHAFLVTGGTRDDRTQLVLRAAEALLGRKADSLREAEAENLVVVRPRGPTRTIAIGDPEEPGTIRGMEKRFHSAAGGALRFGVVVDADRLQDASANAFLKTLEEPPAGVLLFLLTAQPEALLPTIRSRCLGIRLTQPPPPGLGDEAGEVLRAALQRQFETTGSLGSAMGLAGIFQSLLKQEKQRLEKESEAQYKEEIAQYQNATEGDWLKQREAHHKARVLASYLQRREELLGMILAWLGDVLRQACGLAADGLSYPDEAGATAAAAERHGKDEMLRKLEVLTGLAHLFQTNASEPLAIEVSFLNAFGTAPAG